MKAPLKEIFCRLEYCLGCRACEIACAVEHSLSKELAQAVNERPKPVSRVRVLCLEDRRSQRALRSVALQCRHCLEPACAEACIAGGIVRDEGAGVVRFHSEKCVGCWSCVMVCPYGAVVRVSALGIAAHCDRCPDRVVPACVEACPARALLFLEKDAFEALYREEAFCHHRE